MSGPAFFTTRMGQRFFEATMPQIADELKRLNTTLGSIATALQALLTRLAPPLDSIRPADAAVDWEATLAQIAREHLQIDTLDSQGADALGFHEIAASALGVALRAAYQAGIAANLRNLRTNPPASAPERAHEPR